MFNSMTSTVVVGGFFGDEGKGKVISYLAIKDNPKIIVRGGAGPNAGHTIKEGGQVYKVRMLPSGFLNKNAKAPQKAIAILECPDGNPCSTSSDCRISAKTSAGKAAQKLVAPRFEKLKVALSPNWPSKNCTVLST